MASMRRGLKAQLSHGSAFGAHLRGGPIELTLRSCDAVPKKWFQQAQVPHRREKRAALSQPAPPTERMMADTPGSAMEKHPTR